jgi:hypothetical protein
MRKSNVKHALSAVVNDFNQSSNHPHDDYSNDLLDKKIKEAAKLKRLMKRTQDLGCHLLSVEYHRRFSLAVKELDELRRELDSDKND